MDDGASGTPVAIGERMDRLELGVDDRSVHQSLDVVPAGERNEVIHRCGDAVVVGWR